MSIVASFCVCFMLVLRRCRLLPNRCIAFLWVIPMLRFVSFAGLQSKYSLMSLMNKLANRQIVRPVNFAPFQISAPPVLVENISATNIVQGASIYFPITYKVNVLEGVFAVAGVIWIIVGLALLLCFGILYYITMQELRESERLYGNVYMSNRVDAPSIYGVIKPRIILPAVMAQEDHTYILLHESEHIRRGDNLWRVIAFAICAVHWFNPFAWIFLKCYLSDIELACDETVLRKCTKEQRKEYARALLRCAEKKNAFTSAFGGARIRVRIQHILSYRELSFGSALIFILFSTVILYTLLTNAI